MEVHRDFHAMDQPTKQMVLHVLMSACGDCSKEGGHTAYRLPHLQGRVICQPAFCLLADVHYNTLADRRRHLRENRTVHPPEHGNARGVGNKAVPPLVRTAVAEFLAVTSKKFGEARPDAVAKLVFLPPFMTKRSIYAAYLGWIEKQVPPVGLVAWSTFRGLWATEAPLLRVFKSERGLCATCVEMREAMRTLPDEKVAETAEKFDEHIRLATLARAVYNDARELAAAAWKSPEDGRLAVGHISFDFARALEYPHWPRETAEQWFVPAVRALLFGVVNEGSGMHKNYVYPEPGKHDAQSVVSMVHHAVTQDVRLRNCKTLHLNCDSCGGQNKNCFVVNYFVCRILAGHHDEVFIHFMVKGHTKFSPDGGFGNIRMLYKRMQVMTLAQVVEMVKQAAASSDCVNFANGAFYSLEALNTFFKKIPAISKVSDIWMKAVRDGNGTVVNVEVRTRLPGAATEWKQEFHGSSICKFAWNDVPKLDAYFADPQHLLPRPMLTQKRRKILEDVAAKHLGHLGTQFLAEVGPAGDEEGDDLDFYAEKANRTTPTAPIEEELERELPPTPFVAQTARAAPPATRPGPDGDPDYVPPRAVAREVRCTKCRIVGHKAKDCPTAAAQQGDAPAAPHGAAAIAAVPATAAVPPEGPAVPADAWNPTDRCVKCGEVGHGLAACPNRAVQDDSQPGDAGNVSQNKRNMRQWKELEAVLEQAKKKGKKT
jgi:hypothetical protein